MAKLRKEEITRDDIQAFLECDDDFAFEMMTLDTLTGKHYSEDADFDHGGTYRDPVTDKPREFDIRMILPVGEFSSIGFAIECKNVRANFPLVVSRVPRTSRECFVDVIHRSPANIRCKRHERSSYLYEKGEPVGKSCTQIGREAHGDQALTSDQRHIWDKWSQAVGSMSEIVNDAAEGRLWTHGEEHETIVFPIVVVPDGKLWVNDYDQSGHRSSPPQAVNETDIFIGHTHSTRSNIGAIQVTTSHLRIVTLSMLNKSLIALRDSFMSLR